MSELLKQILLLPYRFGSVVHRINDEFDAHQLFVRQPKHCTVLVALFLSWPAALGETELSDPNTALEQVDITARFQTMWALYRDEEQLRCSSAELLARLNLRLSEQNMRWLVMLTYRCAAQKDLYTVCIGDSVELLSFPPYTPGKRIIRSPRQAIESIVAIDDQCSTPIQSPYLGQLLGPKKDLWASTATPTPRWLMLRFVRKEVPTAEHVLFKTASGSLD